MQKLHQINQFLGKYFPSFVLFSVCPGVLFPEFFDPLNHIVVGLFAFMTFANSLGGGFRELGNVFLHPLPALTTLILLHIVMPVLTLVLVMVVVFLLCLLGFLAGYWSGRKKSSILDSCAAPAAHFFSFPGSFDRFHPTSLNADRIMEEIGRRRTHGGGKADPAAAGGGDPAQPQTAPPGF